MIELAAFAIVGLFVAVRMRFGQEPRTFLRRFALLVVASLLVEDSAIRAYGFYFYDAGWSLFLDRVPLAIVTIWPVVILSSWELARSLLGPRQRAVPLVGALLVLADASLIEPVSVRAGLWTWTEPGLFDVPPIGILGWAFYAGFCMAVFQAAERRQSRRLEWLSWVAPALGTHALLIASWWGLFHWVNGPWKPWPVVGLAWIASVSLALLALRMRSRERVEPRELLARVPAAMFFFVLLAVFGRRDPALVLYALAFVPPYLALMRRPSKPLPVSAAPLARRSNG